MSDKTGIEWTEATWNPVVGCTKVSPGCKHCYAERLHEQRHKAWTQDKAMPIQYAEPFEQVRTLPERLDAPLHWKKPRLIFVNSMSDLFHEDVPVSFIQAVFTVMSKARQHTFQVLTKRANRMNEILNTWQREGLTLREGFGVSLPNVWLGVSVEDQQRADERVPELLRTPAAVRFLSCEPLLGAVDLAAFLRSAPSPLSPPARGGENSRVLGAGSPLAPDPSPLQWVIAGGESGPGARPMHPDWARSLRDACAAAGVPFFFKQWGEWEAYEQDAQAPFWTGQRGMMIDGHALPEGLTSHEEVQGWYWPVENSTEGCIYRKVGKKRAGRLLDGVLHDAMPEPQPTGATTP